jgi:hypothetical protein
MHAVHFEELVSASTCESTGQLAYIDPRRTRGEEREHVRMGHSAGLYSTYFARPHEVCVRSVNNSQGMRKIGMGAFAGDNLSLLE